MVNRGHPSQWVQEFKGIGNQGRQTRVARCQRSGHGVAVTDYRVAAQMLSESGLWIFQRGAGGDQEAPRALGSWQMKRCEWRPGRAGRDRGQTPPGAGPK